MKKTKRIMAFLLSAVMVFSVSVTACAAEERDYKVGNPYENVNFSAVKQYKADLHSHTTFSDGGETLPAMVERHYELGFDILAITDHGTVSRGYTTQEHNDPIKLVSWVKNGDVYKDVLSRWGLTSAKKIYRVYTVAGDEYYSEVGDRGMLRVPYGIEQNPTSFNNAHVNTWFADYGDGVLGGTSDYLTPISAVDELGGLSVINHPGEYTGARDEDCLADAYNVSDPLYGYKISKFANILTTYPSCIGIDINSKGDSRTRYDRKLWDILLERVVPQGRNVFAIASTDAHNLNIVDSGYTLMLMKENTSAALKNCLAGGEFFAASKYVGCVEELERFSAELKEAVGTADALKLAAVIDEDLEEGEKFYADEDSIAPKITNITVDEKKDTISLVTKGAVLVHWIADGEVIHVGNRIDLDDYSDKIGSYVRAEVLGEGGILYTQAFTLEYEGAPAAQKDFFYDFGTLYSALCDYLIRLLPDIIPLRLIFAIAGK